MISTYAAQLIFTRLESEYSPTSCDGYQIVYKPKTLSASDTSDIERRIQCFQSDSSRSTRLQFFRTPSGLFVLTSTRELPNSCLMNDRRRREGIFLVQALILSAREMTQCNFDVFSILSNFDEITSFEEVYQGKQTELPQKSIHMSKNSSHIESKWERDDMYRFLSLSLNAEGLAHAGRCIRIYGSPDETTLALSNAFAFIPISHRPMCTFDTMVDGCLIQPNDYFIQGTTSSLQSENLTIDAASRKVFCDYNKSELSNNLFTKWLVFSEEFSKRLPSLPITQYTQLLSNALSNGGSWPENVDINAIESFYQCHRSEFERQLSSLLTTLFNERITSTLLPYLQDHTNFEERLKLIAVKSIETQDTLNLVTEWLIQSHYLLEDSDISVICVFAKESNEATLYFLAHALKRQIDYTALLGFLRNIDENTYRSLLKYLGNPIGIDCFVAERHMNDLLLTRQINEISGHDVVTFFKSVLLLSNPIRDLTLIQTSSLVEQLGPFELGQLENTITNEVVPQEFLVAIERRRNLVNKNLEELLSQRLTHANGQEIVSIIQSTIQRDDRINLNELDIIAPYISKLSDSEFKVICQEIIGKPVSPSFENAVEHKKQILLDRLTIQKEFDDQYGPTALQFAQKSLETHLNDQAFIVAEFIQQLTLMGSNEVLKIIKHLFETTDKYDPRLIKALLSAINKLGLIDTLAAEYASRKNSDLPLINSSLSTRRIELIGEKRKAIWAVIRTLLYPS